MIGKNNLKRILSEGKRLSSQEYYGHWRIHHVKTFYFFCMNLSRKHENKAMSSTELNAYIFSELRRSNITKSKVSKKFNPQGFFGRAWTNWPIEAKNETNFKNEYYEVLLRIGDRPYSYQIKPECFEMVEEIFAELENSV